MVYRQVQHLTDVLRVLEVEGLMWVKMTKVSKQALSQRLNSLPATLFALLFEQVIERLAAIRRLYFFNYALLLNPELQLIPWLVEH
ncbi:hypothetical protein [Nodularia sp. UHCC 0506]|uniref:hypothetical protein n=1 Tax=Nodularia sp. UHCC 0506 TaxID=3110243 RepID=UPI002B1EE68D|nr:hypothetical protein [Nodularia sp. UHCC 0506]MEA5513501.1 hypothetical protein [Nodularia sp. UHCC 0506]